MQRRQPHSHTPSTDSRRGCMRETQLFAGLDAAALRDVDRRSTLREALPGTTLALHPGTIMVVKLGLVCLRRARDGRLLALLDHGSVFGECTLVGETCAGLRVEVLELTQLCTMHEADLRELVRAYPRVGLNLLELVGRRAGGRVA